METFYITRSGKTAAWEKIEDEPALLAVDAFVLLTLELEGPATYQSLVDFSHEGTSEGELKKSIRRLYEAGHIEMRDE